ncbi:hypothetical protein HLH36_10160, partial [Gluconacetobacter aggeris]|nr:hypothetical protein [Gluconacetobacter aggeris]
NATGSIANTLAGIAITADAATPDQGTWRYSTDGGKSWTTLPSDLSPTNALVLPQSAQLQFVPAPNYNGQPGGLTATLIDSSTDVPVYTDATGTPVTGAQIATATTARSGVDVSHPGGTTALSVNSVPLTTIVAPVNDAPTMTGAPTMPSEPEDTTSAAPGSTVASLLGPVFADTADQQKSAGNATGSTANTLAGMAITGDAADPATQGAWRYSTDGGQTWTALPANLSSTNALVLSGNAQLDFVPVANFNGQPGGLTTQVIDSSNAAQGAAPLYTDPTTGNPVYGADLANATNPIAQTGVDVSHAGGTSSISATTEPLTIQVTPVNDAPIASGSATLAAGTEDATGPARTVGSLFGGNFSDTADQQKSAGNATGSIANTLAGIAITADAATPDQGTWRYSTDGGKSWQPIDPATLSPNSAIILPDNAQLSFQPASNFNGSPGKLTVALIETGSTLINGTDASRADVSALMNDPTSAVSNGTVTLGTTVINTRPQGSSNLSSATGSDGLSSASMVVSSVDDAFNTAFDRGIAAAHQTWIRGSVTNSFITVDQASNIPVPMGAFMTENGTEAQLQLTASQADGSPLPDWLSFNAQSRLFNGTAPDNAFGSLDLKVVGRDAFGHEAQVDIHIVIGHQHQLMDMIDLQATPRTIQQAFDVIQNDINRLFLDSHITPIDRQPAGHGKPSLRSQLRHLGAKAHQRDARALLDRRALHNAEP